jgi:diguanylate cyclase (GGDEF)-like protein/PAS domain S-box-containing protein
MDGAVDRLVDQHDPTLAAVAAVACLLASLTAFRLYARGVASRGEARPAWLVLTGVVTGFGLWSTHAIAFLSWDPGAPVAIAGPAMLLSLGIAVAMSSAAFLSAANLEAGLRAIVAGVLFGFGVVSMHFASLSGLEAQGDVRFNPALIAMSLALAAGLSTTAFAAAGDVRETRQQVIGGTLLAAAIALFYATAMASLSIRPDPAMPLPHGGIGSLPLVISVASAMLVVIAVGLGAALVDARASEQAVARLRRLADNAFEGIVLAANGRIVDANSAYLRLIGAKGEEIIGKPVDDVLIDTIQRSPDAGRLEAALRPADGDAPIPVEVRTRTLSEDGAESVMAVRDLRDQRAADARIRYLADHDPLTGLLNRAAFRTRLAAAFDHAAVAGQGIALVYVDLDYFKDVNDIHGHAVGDSVLREVGERLKSVVAAPSFVARIGGDEFVIVQIDDNQPTAAIQLVGALSELLRERYLVAGNALAIGASFGVSLFPDDALDADELLSNADMALYRAKASGRATYSFFQREMDDAVRRRRALARDLRDAIPAGQLRLDYQPLVDLDGDRVTGFEALVRWDHPTRGPLEPEAFIGCAEENGLITALGDWVLEQAVHEAAAWPEDKIVAVNLSPLQVHDEGLPKRIAAALAASDLDPGRLELEITETALFRDREKALSNLARLKALGVRIAMDDFGTGYSSLSTLQSFPFDKIKIDRSFIGEMAERERAFAIVQAIVGLGESLGVPVTAEGVETPQQLGVLRELGCAQVQGFLFGRPKAIDDQADLFEPLPPNVVRFSAPDRSNR